MEFALIHKSFPFLSKSAIEEIQQHAVAKSVKKGDIIVNQGQYLNVLPLVINGSIRVFQQNEDREILLYYVEKGETCIMSLTACFFSTPSQSSAVAEKDTDMLLIPKTFIYQWQRQFPEWNEFTINTFRNRYDELLNAFNGVVFNHIETRLHDYLTTYSKKQAVKLIPLTHNELANELGTTRVVISRLLKRWEEDGKVTLQRKGVLLK